MRAVLQRVSRAAVTVAESVVGEIARGWLVLLAVAEGDGDSDADKIAEKIKVLRGFEDDTGKMNLDVLEASGGVLVVSQFTLLADCRKGRRPSFINAAQPAEAERLYLRVCEKIASSGVPTQRGIFRAQMQVALVNDGPVTFLLDTAQS
jgi:D-tyrosyl-tRNA(Tyr) deacylase